MNIVICEDDIQFCNYIKSILEKYIVNNHFNSKIVLTTSNPDNVINYIHNNSEITIYYLDIKLQNNKSGFDIASIIRENDYMSPIIFITNYEEMMSLTYEYKLEALDFIIKNNLASLRQRICENLKYIETRQQKGYMKCLNIKSILQVLCKYKIVQKNLFKWTELNSVRFYVIRKISTCQ